MSIDNKHCGCTTHNKVRIKNPHYPFLGSLLIVLLPKCPFCIMAYTSAITVCSAKSMSGYSPQWTSWISILLATLTFLIVAWNYKGRKTIVACALILVGVLLITQSELFSGLLTGYYWGSGLLILGVWVNGNFSSAVSMFASRTEKNALEHG
jgi:hypothetical protein